MSKTNCSVLNPEEGLNFSSEKHSDEDAQRHCQQWRRGHGRSMAESLALLVVAGVVHLDLPAKVTVGVALEKNDLHFYVARLLMCFQKQKSKFRRHKNKKISQF